MTEKRHRKREDLFERLSNRTVTRQMRRGLEFEDAQDTAQEAILIALERSIEQNGEDALFGYTDKTARRKLIDLSRRNKMKRRRHVPIIDEGTFNLHQSTLPEKETIHRERMTAMRDAIRTLSIDQQEIMLLLAQGYSNEEIAERTKTNAVTVRTRISKARAKLREQLELFK